MPDEVFAAEYKAKKRVNELKQMRQFFKNGQSDKTKTWVKEQQKKSHASSVGSWDIGAENVPDRSQNANARPSHAVNVTLGSGHTDPAEWDLLASLRVQGPLPPGRCSSQCLLDGATVVRWLIMKPFGHSASYMAASSWTWVA